MSSLYDPITDIGPGWNFHISNLMFCVLKALTVFAQLLLVLFILANAI